MNPSEPQDSNDPSQKQQDVPQSLMRTPEHITPDSVTPEQTAPEQTTTEEFPIAAPTNEPDASPVDMRVNVGQDTSPDAMIVSPGGGSVVQPKQVSPSTTTTTTFGASSPEGAAKNKRGLSKKLLFTIVAATAILAAGAAYVFAFYLPNRPSAVYATSFSNTADAVDALIEEAKTLYDTDSYTGVAATADFSYAANGSAADGSATMNVDRSGVFNGTVDLNFMGQKFNAEVRGVDVEQSESPDIYLKVEGLSALESYLGADMTTKLNDQWIVFDHTLLDGAQSAVTGEEAVDTLPSKEQVYDATAAVQQVNRAYLFTDDTEKAVFRYDEYVGKEQLHDRDVYHYKVSVDKVHLKSYIGALGKALDESKLNDWAKQQNDDKPISELFDTESLLKQVDELANKEQFDMYVDLKSKLIQSFGYNAEDHDGTSSRILISQLYTGGDSYPFELSIATSKDGKAQGDASVKLTYSKADKSATLGVAYNGAGETKGTKFSLNLSAKPSTETLKVDAPSGARSINDVVAEMFGGYGVLGEQTTVPNVPLLTQLGIGE